MKQNVIYIAGHADLTDGCQWANKTQCCHCRPLLSMHAERMVQEPAEAWHTILAMQSMPPIQHGQAHTSDVSATRNMRTGGKAGPSFHTTAPAHRALLSCQQLPQRQAPSLLTLLVAVQEEAEAEERERRARAAAKLRALEEA